MATKTLEVTIGDDGTIQCLAPDDLDLTELGRCDVRRASHVEFDNAVQAWEVRLPNGRLLGHFPTRGEALAHEVRYLNAKIDDGTVEEVF